MLDLSPSCAPNFFCLRHHDMELWAVGGRWRCPIPEQSTTATIRSYWLVRYSIILYQSKHTHSSASQALCSNTGPPLVLILIVLSMSILCIPYVRSWSYWISIVSFIDCGLPFKKPSQAPWIYIKEYSLWTDQAVGPPMWRTLTPFRTNLNMRRASSSAFKVNRNSHSKLWHME